MLRTWVRRALALVALTAGLLTIAGPSYATTAPRVLGAVTLSYRVVSGDTLWDLAGRWCGDPRRYLAIAAASGISDPDRIDVGQLLTIPCARAGSRSPAPPPVQANPPRPATWVHPLWPGARITGCYGDPRDDGTRKHHGIDIHANRGALIRAVGAGTVMSARWRSGYGRTVEVRHPNGGYTTLYAHGSALLVRAGQRVSAGQGIARVGDTGNPAPGAYHLHLEVRQYGVAVTRPGAWFRARGVRMGCA